MKAPANGFMANSVEVERRSINSELWHACAGPLVSLPPVGSLVVYFPQGHSEQVAASMQKGSDGQIPNYPNLPSKLICILHNVTLHADPETDEVYAQMTLQPVNKYDKDALMASDMALKQSKQPTEFFCKTLTASDTSTHGGFSVPRRAAEKIFPPLDFTMQPPAQELVARDLHDVPWTFRHIYRGQPKRHLLTTGWSVFVSTKRLFAGDSVLFIRDEKSHLLLGIRRANRQQPALSSSVLSSDSMHIGILAAAAHAAANHSPFTIFYNPRASPSEFVVPLSKYNKAMYTQVSLGMRFRMMFETEESGVRRYMGTITGISDLDQVRWKNSQWRNLQVGWDEATAGERQTRVSVWEIEPVATPFYICPPPFFRSKLPRQPGMPDDESEIENAFKRAMPWLGDEFEIKDAQSSILPGLSLVQWMSMQQQNSQMLNPIAQTDCFPSMAASAVHNIGTDDPSKQLNFQAQALSLPNLQFNISKLNQQSPQVDQFQQQPFPWPQQQKQQQVFANQTQQQTFANQTQQQTFANQTQQQTLANQTQQQTQIQNPILQQNLAHSKLQQQQKQQQTFVNPTPTQTHLQNQALQHNLIKSQLQQQQKQQQCFANQSSPQTQIQNHLLQQNLINSQMQQQRFLVPNQQLQQNILPPNQNSVQTPALTQNSPLQQQPEHQQSLSQRQQQQLSLSQQQQVEHQQSLSQRQQQQLPLSQQQQVEHQQSLSQRQQQQLPLSQQQLQLQLQKLQQQQLQQQLLSHVSSHLLPPPQQQQQSQQQSLQFQQHQAHQQNLQFQQHQAQQIQPLQQQQQLPGSHQSQSQQKLQQDVQLPNKSVQLLPFSSNHLPPQLKSPLPPARAHSGLTDGDAPSCSTSPSTNNCHISPSYFNKPHQVAEETAQSANNLIQELQAKSNSQIKHELPLPKEPDPATLLAYRSANTENMEASSSATSFCLDGSIPQNFQMPSFQTSPFLFRDGSQDGEAQNDPRNNLLFGVNIDGLMPETLLSRGFGSGKDLQNLLTGYGSQRDIETELSTAAISSQSFGVPDMSFKPGCSGDAAVNDSTVINRGAWPQQPQRMRTYTKVQKRGSVGRTIDVTRYKGYDELQHDLACMFGIEGQLEDPHRTDWKLVYVDHENDILLVGDDPWEEFVTCVQSIKILSSAEVQQMSLDGDLANMPVQNQACSGGSDSGNVWRGHCDDNSIASFDH